MAEFHFNNPHLTVNSVDLSDHVVAIELGYGSETLDITAGGDAVRNFIAGLKTVTFNVTFNQDFAAGEVYATLFPLVGAAGVAVAVRAVNTTIAATNPEFQFSAFVSSFPLLTGAMGTAQQPQVTFTNTTDITADVTP